MSNDNIINVKNNSKPRFWAIWQICCATFFATPFVGGYFISRNFKLLNLKRQSRNALIIGVLINLILLPAIALICEKLFFNSIDPKGINGAVHGVLIVIFIMLVCKYAKKTQASSLQKLRDSGVKSYSILSWFWKCLILFLLGFILFAIGIIPLIMIYKSQGYLQGYLLFAWLLRCLIFFIIGIVLFIIGAIPLSKLK